MSDGPPPRESTDGSRDDVTGAASLDRLRSLGETDGTTRSDGEDGDGDDESAALRTRLRRLEEENERLREQYAGVSESRYVRTALGLATVGIVFGAVGFVVPSAQEVLFTIAAAGLFGAVLTRYLTPEQFVPLDVGEGIYTTLAGNEAALADQLGLSSTRVYLTTDHGPRLVVPEIDGYEPALLDSDELEGPLVVGDRASRSGLSLRPVAEPLLSAVESQSDGLPTDPREAVPTLHEEVTDVLELADGVDSDIDAAGGRVTFEVDDPLYGSGEGFDHPVGSFLGSRLATALGAPVHVAVQTTEADGSETLLVTCRWDANGIETNGEGPDASEADGDSSDPEITEGDPTTDETESTATDSAG
jgi:hypothetical protein